MPRLLPHICDARGIVGILYLAVVIESADLQRDTRGQIGPSKVDAVAAVGTDVDGVSERKRRGHDLPAAVVDVFADEIDAARRRDGILELFFFFHG